LAREIKCAGNIWLGLTQKARSIRKYAGLSEIGRMISRNAFFQLRHSILLLIATVLALALTYLAPPCLVFVGGWAAIWGGVGWLLMSIAFWPMVRFYSLSPLWAAMLPLIALFYTAATLHSAVQYWVGRGGSWKGRIQDGRGGLRSSYLTKLRRNRTSCAGLCPRPALPFERWERRLARSSWLASGCFASGHQSDALTGQ